MCATGKHPFPTEHDARVALVGAAIARNMGRNRRRETRTYPCDLCGAWHLTSKPYRKDPEA